MPKYGTYGHMAESVLISPTLSEDELLMKHVLNLELNWENWFRGG